MAAIIVVIPKFIQVVIVRDHFLREIPRMESAGGDRSAWVRDVDRYDEP
jgi:hypothetical protein